MPIIVLTGVTAKEGFHLGGLNFYSIIVNKTSGVTVSLSKTTVSKDTAASETVTGTLTVAEGYTLSSVKIMMGDTDMTSSWYDSLSGEINIIGISANVTITAIATSNSGIGGVETTNYTITYKYMCGSTEIKAATTETVVAGISKTFNVSNAPTISGYTASSVSPTNATINSNTTVTYTYTANESGGNSGSAMLLDLDFTSKTVSDYVSAGVLSLGSSTASDLTYGAKGLECNDTDLRYGLKLTNPIDVAGAFTAEVVVTIPLYENSGSSATESNYNYFSILSGVDSDTDSHTHGTTCLAPCFNDFNQQAQLRLIELDSTGVSLALFFLHDGEEHTYKIVKTADGSLDLYRDGAKLGTKTIANAKGKFGYVLGIHKGYNYATQYATEKGIIVKSIKVY